MRVKYHPTIEEMNLSMILHALSDPIRLKIVLYIVDNGFGEHSCGTIDVPVVKSTVSHHIRTLRESGVVRVRTQGTQNFISLRYEELEQRFPGVLSAVVASAKQEPMAASQQSSKAQE